MLKLINRKIEENIFFSNCGMYLYGENHAIDSFTAIANEQKI